MKVNKTLRDLYSDAEPKFKRLRADIRDVLKPKVEERGWFFTDRLKEELSFALKVETGRVPDPSELEDFYACSVIVPNRPAVIDAEELVRAEFTMIERRPPRTDETFKTPSDFRFDDLRLYVKRGSRPSGRDADLANLIFEVQIKTQLQYAWGVATHDLIYKTDSMSWPKERIAFQIKAMLEHAEVAIAEAELLSRSPSVLVTDRNTANILIIIEHLNEIWSKDALPSDLKRLAQNIGQLLKLAGVQAADLPAILDQEISRVGKLPVDLSPYAFTLQAIAWNPSINFERKLRRASRGISVIIHKDMEVPDWMRDRHEKILNLDTIHSI